METFPTGHWLCQCLFRFIPGGDKSAPLLFPFAGDALSGDPHERLLLIGCWIEPDPGGLEQEHTGNISLVHEWFKPADTAFIDQRKGFQNRSSRRSPASRTSGPLDKIPPERHPHGSSARQSAYHHIGRFRRFRNRAPGMGGRRRSCPSADRLSAEGVALETGQCPEGGFLLPTPGARLPRGEESPLGVLLLVAPAIASSLVAAHRSRPSRPMLNSSAIPRDHAEDKKPARQPRPPDRTGKRKRLDPSLKRRGLRRSFAQPGTQFRYRIHLYRQTSQKQCLSARLSSGSALAEH